MEISAVSAFTALTPNSKIIASASDAPSIRPVQRVTRKANEISDTSFIINSSGKNNLQDKITLLGEKSNDTGKAYGLDINELRKQGLKNQLYESSVNNENNNINQTIDEDEEINDQAVDQENETTNSEKLSKEEEIQVQKLKDRDKEVRVHEQAHIAASGGLVQGGASYTYEQGPDGKRYAIGGEVSIDTSEGKTPEETIEKMSNVIRAALAPAEPSSQDRAVAAAASQTMSKAKQEKNSQEIDNDEHSKLIKTDDQIADKENKIEENSAINGKDAETVIESGLVNMSVSENNVITNEANNYMNKSIPQAKLSMQQIAAKIAYGISA